MKTWAGVVAMAGVFLILVSIALPIEILCGAVNGFCHWWKITRGMVVEVWNEVPGN